MYTQDLLLFSRWLSRGGRRGLDFVSWRGRGTVLRQEAAICAAAKLPSYSRKTSLVIWLSSSYVFYLDSYGIPYRLLLVSLRPCMWCIAQLCCRTDFNRALFLAGLAVLRRVLGGLGFTSHEIGYLIHFQVVLTCDSSLKMIHNWSKHVGGIML